MPTQRQMVRQQWKHDIPHRVKDKARKKILVNDEDEIDEIIQDFKKRDEKNYKEAQKKFEHDIYISERQRVLQEKVIAGLTVKRESPSTCIENPSGWKKVSLAMDSGAYESVIDAEECLPDYEVKETKA